MGRSRAAAKAGIFHLLFNIAAVAVGPLLIDRLVDFGAATAGDVGQRIANAHVLFSIAGARAALPLTGFASRRVEQLVPERRKASIEPAAGA